MQSEPRKPGRPRKDEKPITEPVVQADLQRFVPAMKCPECGRGMQPRILRWRMVKEIEGADCTCALCSKTFHYVPGHTMRYR